MFWNGQWSLVGKDGIWSLYGMEWRWKKLNGVKFWVGNFDRGQILKDLCIFKGCLKVFCLFTVFLIPL